MGRLHYLLLAILGCGDCCWPFLVDLALAEAACLGTVGGGCRCRSCEDGIQHRRMRQIFGRWHYLMLAIFGVEVFAGQFWRAD